MNDRYQFSLKRLLIGVAVSALLLGIGRWYYLKFVYGLPLSQTDALSDYVGQRVTIDGKLFSGKGPAHLQFGDEVVEVPGVFELSDGKSVAVTGWLVVIPPQNRGSSRAKYRLCGLFGES